MLVHSITLCYLLCAELSVLTFNLYSTSFSSFLKAFQIFLMNGLGYILFISPSPLESYQLSCSCPIFFYNISILWCIQHYLYYHKIFFIVKHDLNVLDKVVCLERIPFRDGLKIFLLMF